MDQSQEHSIVDSLETLAQLSSTDGLVVKFNAGSGMDPLKTTIINAMQEWKLTKGKNAPLSKAEKEHNRQEKQDNEKLRESVNKLNGQTEIVQTTLKEEKDTLSNIAKTGELTLAEQKKQKRKEKNEQLREWNQKFMAMARVIGTIKNVTKDTLGKVTDAAAQRLDWAMDLQESGVRLSEGFDESFTKLSNTSGRLQDDFVKLLTSNSKSVSRMNAMGLNASRNISEMAGSVVGKWGVTGKEADSVLKNYIENMTMFDDINTARNRDYNLEMEKSTKMFKGLSAATGKSVEQLVEETKAREKNFLHQRLATDDKTKEQYATLKAVGMSDDMIEAILLGKANKASVMASATPQEARLLKNMQQLAKSTAGRNDGSFMEGFAELQKSSDAQYVAQKKKNANLNNLMYANQESAYVNMSTGASWGDVLRNVLDIKGKDKQLDNENVETKAANASIEYQANVNRMQNTLQESISPSLSTISTILPKINDGLSSLESGMEKLGVGLGAMQLTGSLLGSLVNNGFGGLLLKNGTGLAKGVGKGLWGLGKGALGVAKGAGGLLLKGGAGLLHGAGAMASSVGSAVTSGASTVAGLGAGTLAAGAGAFAAGGAVGYGIAKGIDSHVGKSDKADVKKYDQVQQKFTSGENLTKEEMDLLQNGVKLGWWGFRSTYGAGATEQGMKALTILRERNILKKQKSENGSTPSITENGKQSSMDTETTTQTQTQNVVKDNNQVEDKKEDSLNELVRKVTDILMEMKTSNKRPITNMTT